MTVVAVIVVDTNILVASPRLGGREWLSLIEHAEEWGIRIVVPEVVFMETVNVVRRNWSERRKQLVDLKLGEFGLNDDQAAMVAEIDRRSDEYEGWLRGHLRPVLETSHRRRRVKPE